MTVVTNNTIQPSSGQALTIKDEGGTASITVATNGEATFAENIIIGTAGKGITFQDTDSSNDSTTANEAYTLDSYETGTWTLTGSGSSGAEGSYAQTVWGTPYYTKIGNMVTLGGAFSVTNKGSYSGEFRISGLPFQVDAGNNFGCYGSVRLQDVDYDAGGNLMVEAGNGLSHLRVQVSVTGTGNNPMQFSELTTSSYIVFTITYRTNS